MLVCQGGWNRVEAIIRGKTKKKSKSQQFNTVDNIITSSMYIIVYVGVCVRVCVNLTIADVKKTYEKKTLKMIKTKIKLLQRIID